MTQIINMTPHDVHILDENGQRVHTFPFSGHTIRLAVDTVRDGSIEIRSLDIPGVIEITCIPTSRTVFRKPQVLPEEQIDRTVGDCYTIEVYQMPSTYYIVSQLVKNAFPDRKDLLVPAEVVRDEKGNILGCRSLGR